MFKGFLGLKYPWWGVDVLKDILLGKEWIETSNFPRVTMCDFEVHSFYKILTLKKPVGLEPGTFVFKLFYNDNIPMEHRYPIFTSKNSSDTVYILTY